MSRACHELLSWAKNRKQKAELLKNQKETTLNHAGLQRACGHAEAGLGCRSSSDNALSMEEGRDGFLHARDMACGQEAQDAEADEAVGRAKDCAGGVCRGGQANPIQTRQARLPALQRTKRDGTPCRRLALRDLKVCELHGGILALARQGKLQRSGRTVAFKATRAAMIKGRSPPAPLDLIRLSIYRQANEWTRIRLARAWQTTGWPALVRQIKSRDI